MNCDVLASSYRTLEYLAFARALERARFAFLEETAGLQRALVLGEGDGRFVSELARNNATVAIDCIEASGKMIEAARKRLRRTGVSVPERVQFLQRDARLGIAGDTRYDLIVTHFFLDCFSGTDVQALISQIRNVCAPEARWLIAEFQQPESGWRKWHAGAWLTAMYGFFRIATRLETRVLPDYRQSLTDAGFVLQRGYSSYAQLICSEMWQLPPADG